MQSMSAFRRLKTGIKDSHTQTLLNNQAVIKIFTIQRVDKCLDTGQNAINRNEKVETEEGNAMKFYCVKNFS